MNITTVRQAAALPEVGPRGRAAATSGDLVSSPVPFASTTGALAWDA
jgi:hypothetical protein